MDAEGFVEVLRLVVHDATVRGVRETLEDPPGRAPQKELVEMSTWYLGLNDADKAMVGRIIARTSHSTMFGWLCVLDGVRAIEGFGEKGTLELEYVGVTGDRVLLNDPDKIFLHDLW